MRLAARARARQGGREPRDLPSRIYFAAPRRIRRVAFTSYRERSPTVT